MSESLTIPGLDDEFTQHTYVFAARDKSGSLWMFNREPKRGVSNWYLEGGSQPNESVCLNDFIVFADLTWQSSPLKIQVSQQRKSRYYKVDSEFELAGQIYKVVMNNDILSCAECIFKNDMSTCQTMRCISSLRDDENYVYYEPAEHIERNLGDIFRVAGNTFTVVKSDTDDCTGCYFGLYKSRCFAPFHLRTFGPCFSRKRKDRTDVKFVRVKNTL